MGVSVPLVRPGTEAGESEKVANSHAASASASVFDARANVAAGVACFVDFARCGIVPIGGMRNGGRGHESLLDGSSIQSCTASSAQPDQSADETLCPTPGTTMSFPCGNCATTDCAPAVGVRMS